MVARTSYDAQVDGVSLSIQIEGETTSDDDTPQDPAVVREFVARLSEAVEKALYELERT
jgi:hypothetical protein